MKSESENEKPRAATKHARGHCLCGAVVVEIDFPAFWAWHDHGEPSRRAHGAAYATYIGCWKKKVRIAKGEKHVTRFEDSATNTIRSFCARCGSPLLYERKRSATMINVPRALFTTRTGREPRYHLNIEQQQDWTYTGAPLVPLKGYPGVVWERPKSKKRPKANEFDDAFADAFTHTASRPSRKPRAD